MTSSLSHAPLTLEFRYSPWAVAWLSVLGGVSLSVCWMLPWPVWVAVAVSGAVAVWYWRALRRHALEHGPVGAVRWTRDGWQVTRDGGRRPFEGEWQPATLRAATVWPPLVMLRLSTADGPVICWLPPGRVAAPALRRLRVLLRHGQAFVRRPV